MDLCLLKRTFHHEKKKRREKSEAWQNKRDDRSRKQFPPKTDFSRPRFALPTFPVRKRQIVRTLMTTLTATRSRSNCSLETSISALRLVKHLQTNEEPAGGATSCVPVLQNQTALPAWTDLYRIRVSTSKITETSLSSRNCCDNPFPVRQTHTGGNRQTLNLITCQCVCVCVMSRCTAGCAAGHVGRPTDSRKQ